MNLILIRHGESEGNQNHKIYGWTDYPLTDKGLQQVDEIVAHMQSKTFHKLYTSPLTRTKYIAERIIKDKIINLAHYPAGPCNTYIKENNGMACIDEAEFKEVTYIEDPQLKEMNYGIFEGFTEAEILLKYKEEYNLFLSQFESYSIPSGEGYTQFKDRVLAFFEKFMPNKDETYVYVTHSGVIRQIITHLLNLAPGEIWNYPIHPGCIVELNNHEGRWTITNLRQT